MTINERAHVTRISSNGNGKVTGVQYLWDGQLYFQPFNVVLLASQTYENARLLLIPNPKSYATGLSDDQGQHFISHWAARETRRSLSI